MPKNKKPDVLRFDGEAECVVCRTISEGASVRLPVCSRCQELTPREFLALPPAERKRAALFAAVVIAAHLFGKALGPARRRRR